VQTAQFVLNKGLANEKMMTWSKSYGFASEDSDNPKTAWGRFERKFYHERALRHK